jgi:hypothetical protein
MRGLSFFDAAVFRTGVADRERLMALWDRVRSELDRAGRVAQQAFDEGRLRLEMLRVRRHADSAAQRLGYAVYRARREGRDVTGEEYLAFARGIEMAEAEVERYQRLVDEAAARRRRATSLQHTDPGTGSA